MTYAKQIAEAVLWELAINYQYITGDLGNGVDVDAIIASVPKPEPLGTVDSLIDEAVIAHLSLDRTADVYLAPVSTEPVNVRLLEDQAFLAGVRALKDDGRNWHHDHTRTKAESRIDQMPPVRGIYERAAVMVRRMPEVWRRQQTVTPSARKEQA